MTTRPNQRTLRPRTPGVFLVTSTNAIIHIRCVFSVNTYSCISIVTRGSRWSERASPWTKQASEASLVKQCCKKNESSEQCKRANKWSEWPRGRLKTQLSLTKKAHLLAELSVRPRTQSYGFLDHNTQARSTEISTTKCGSTAASLQGS